MKCYSFFARIRIENLEKFKEVLNAVKAVIIKEDKSNIINKLTITVHNFETLGLVGGGLFNLITNNFYENGDASASIQIYNLDIVKINKCKSILEDNYILNNFEWDNSEYEIII